MKFEHPALPYAANALEPVMSARTVEFHWGKHEAAYINNLNKLLEGTPMENDTLEEIVRKADGAIYNNAAQAWNHIFFFFQLSPDPKKKPEGVLAHAIEDSFGSLEKFKEEFAKAGATLFGSGWAWLSVKPDGKLVISQGSNAHNPLRDGHVQCYAIERHFQEVKYYSPTSALFVPVSHLNQWENGFYCVTVYPLKKASARKQLSGCDIQRFCVFDCLCWIYLY